MFSLRLSLLASLPLLLFLLLLFSFLNSLFEETQIFFGLIISRIPIERLMILITGIVIIR